MTTWTSITARIRACASPKGREQTGAISLEGTRLFERADRAGVRFEHVLVARSFGVGSEREARLLERLRSVAPVTEIPNEAMRELTGGRGIGAICGLAEHPRVPSLDDLLQGDAERRATFLGLVDVEDPGNVGALARTAHAAGARALVTVGGVDAFHPKAIRTSMGSLFRLPVIRFDALSAVVAAFTARGIRSFGATSSSGERVFDADGLTVYAPKGQGSWAAVHIGFNERAAFEARAGLRAHQDVAGPDRRCREQQAGTPCIRSQSIGSLAAVG